MSDFYLIIAALLVSGGYSAVMFHRRQGEDYNTFRRRHPELRWVIGGYTAVLLVSMLGGLLLVPLVWPAANLLHILSVMLFVYALGQALLEMSSGVAIWLRSRRWPRERRTVSLETFYLPENGIRTLGLWRLLVGLLLAGGWLLIR